MPELSVVCVREDARLADQLAAALERFGFSICRSATVYENFQGYAGVIVLLSPFSSRSELVAMTASRALDWGKLIPVFVSLCTVPDRLSGIAMHDLSTWTGSAEDPVIAAIAAHAGRIAGLASRPTLAPAQANLLDSPQRRPALSFDEGPRHTEPAPAVTTPELPYAAPRAPYYGGAAPAVAAAVAVAQPAQHDYDPAYAAPAAVTSAPQFGMTYQTSATPQPAYPGYALAQPSTQPHHTIDPYRGAVPWPEPQHAPPSYPALPVAIETPGSSELTPIDQGANDRRSNPFAHDPAPFEPPQSAAARRRRALSGF
jgi:hypothetical protein